MANRKLRMCRLCLSTNAILRSIFTIFRNHNLVFIIRDYVRLEVKENDNLPKMVCKSCAVKLIRVRENVSLFIDSDRKLRQKLADDNKISEEIEGSEQSKTRKHTRRQEAVDVDKESLEGDDDTSKNPIQINIKQENHLSDSEEDLPLKVLKSVVRNSKPDDREICDIDDLHGMICVKEEESLVDHAAVEPSSFYSVGICDDDCKKTEEILSANAGAKKTIEAEHPKRSTRQTRATHLTISEEVDTDDEDRDISFKVEELEPSSNYCDTDSTSSLESTENVGKNSRQRKGKTKQATKELRKNKKGSRRKPVKKSTSPVPTLHDYKCYICHSESLGSRQALIEHFATHVDRVPYTCSECVMETVVLTRVRTLNTHMKMHAQPVKCDYCDRRYSNAAGKYYHTQTFHLGGGAPCLVTCEVCGKTCGSQNALKQHMKYHTTKLKCSKCDMVFNHPNKRRNHERIHDENRGFECVVCKKVLQTIESYDVHLKKHSQERSYQCHLCPKKFNTSCNLILHLKVHAKNDNYKPAKSWIEHYTVLSRNPMHFKCNHCDRYNTDKVNNMISHLQAHFKEYECDQCLHKFATAKQLRAHYTTHTGEKPEKCKYCDKVFSTKNNLRIHLKASHPECYYKE